MIWFNDGGIPVGTWPFLGVVQAGLREIETEISNHVDLTEGTDNVLISGCLSAYRHAVLRRSFDLAQGIIACWNSHQHLSSLVCGRALLETIAIYHSLLNRAEKLAAKNDWVGIGTLVDIYAMSSSSGQKTSSDKKSPPRVGKAVSEFITACHPGAEQFWHQVCDTAHPNGRRMMMFAGTLENNILKPRKGSDVASDYFAAIYNCLYSCCWLVASDLEFDILVERVRSGISLPPDHALIRRQSLANLVTANLVASAKTK